jgi:hypothetical protein
MFRHQAEFSVTMRIIPGRNPIRPETPIENKIIRHPTKIEF